MTVRKVTITRNAGVRPVDNRQFSDYVWFVDRGQKYDAVEFNIEECSRLAVVKTFAVRVGYPEEKCRQLAEIYAKHIPQEWVDSINEMFDDFERYGCD